MSRRNFHATTALGLCLALVPLASFAQTSETGLVAGDIFVPPVQSCLEETTVPECLEVRAVITDCAEDIEQARCEDVFIEADVVFSDPAQLEQAQRLLTQGSAAIAQLDFDSAADVDLDVEPEVEPEQEAATDIDAPAPPAEPSAEADVEGEVELDVQAEQQLQDALEAEQRALDAEREESTDEAMPPEPEDLQDESAAVDEDAVAEQQLQEALEAEQRALDAERDESLPDEDAAPDAEVLQDETAIIDENADAEQQLRDALETEQSMADDGTEMDAPGDVLDSEEIERDLEEDRAQMRADAEAMAEEEPELVVEDVPEEEFVAPADAQVELDAEQQSVIDRLLSDPETAAAVTILSQMAGSGDPSAPETEDDSTVATALSALQRDRSGDAAQDTDAQAEEVTEDEITAGEIRTSRDDFESRLALDFEAGQARSSDRRDLERAGLVALGALAVGMIVNRNRVVARSDERVVVMDDAGEYAVWRDDDVILNQDGSQRRIERYADGSTLTRWARTDGSEIVTIRDATGRVLWRERVLADGTSIELVNDMREVEAIDVSVLPPPRRRELRITQRTDPALALELLREAEADARALDRAFTLRQVREVREVRELVPVLSPDPITFEVNRANVRPEEARKLSQVGRLMERLIADNPRELFLIEGHTDATGPASYNLALSDRRAESVALALTEFFEIPPENLIIQGYGERYLRIPTAASEERNRRVAIRRISPLLDM